MLTKKTEKNNKFNLFVKIGRRQVYKQNNCFNILQFQFKFQYHSRSGFVVAVVHWESFTMQFRLLFQKFENFKSDLMSKTSHELWLYQRNFVTFFYRLTFSPITDPNYQTTWKSWLCPFLYAMQWASIFYTIYIGRHAVISTIRNLYIGGIVTTVRFKSKFKRVNIFHL